MSSQPQLIPMATGERLRHRRLEAGLDTAEIAEKLHIDEPVLVSMEADRLAHLAPLYRRGYIKSYARFLGFDDSEIEEMLNTVGNEIPELHTVFPEAGHPNQADRWIRATSYVLASLLVGTLAWQFSREALRLSQEVSNGTDRSAVLDPRTEPGTEDPASAATHVNASIASLEGMRRTATRNPAGAQAWEAIQKPVAPDQDSGPGQSVLELSASGDSWVAITDADGTQLELDLLRGGTTKQYVGTAPFNIQFGQPQAISLTMNGQAVDLEPFTRNGVTQMVLERDDYPGNQ